MTAEKVIDPGGFRNTQWRSHRNANEEETITVDMLVYFIYSSLRKYYFHKEMFAKCGRTTIMSESPKDEGTCKKSGNSALIRYEEAMNSNVDLCLSLVARCFIS